MLFKVGLDPNDDKDTVKEKITSNVKDNDGNAVGFPALRSCGEFELMQSSPNCRDLRRIDCCWSARDLKANLSGGQGKIYIGPIYKSLSTKPSQMSENSSLKEECHICHKQILIRELRKHLWDCQDGSRESDEHENDLMQSASVCIQYLTHPLVTTTQSQSQSNSIPSAPDTAAFFASSSGNALVVSITESSPPTTPSTANSDDDKMTVDEVVEKTVLYCRKNDINNPVEILRCL